MVWGLAVLGPYLPYLVSAVADQYQILAVALEALDLQVLWELGIFAFENHGYLACAVLEAETLLTLVPFVFARP